MIMLLWALYTTPMEPVAPTVYYGSSAVERIEFIERRTLSLAERRVVHEEGFVDGCYGDTKGILTCGVGQTGVFQSMSFEDTFKVHAYRAQARFPKWGAFSEALQAELIVMEYRGDLGISPKTVSLINEERWLEASVEFLNHHDYTDWSVGVRKRLERGSAMLANQA